MMYEWLLRGAAPRCSCACCAHVFRSGRCAPITTRSARFRPPLSPSSRILARSGRSARHAPRARSAVLTSAVFLSSIFWHRSLRHSRVRSHHPRALLTRVKNLCLDNEFAESKEDRLNRRDRLARASSPREEAPSLRQGRPPRVSLRYSARGRELGRYPVLRTSTLERHSTAALRIAKAISCLARSLTRFFCSRGVF